MSEEKKSLKLGQQEAIPSEPIRLETEGIFDSAGYPTPSADPFQDDPMKIFASLVGDLKDMAKRPMLLAELPPSEHKVKIFRFNESMIPAQICTEIEALLNDGWCCHMPTVVNDYVIMDFSRRKETEECQQ